VSCPAPKKSNLVYCPISQRHALRTLQVPSATGPVMWLEEMQELPPAVIGTMLMICVIADWKFHERGAPRLPTKLL
jgi:hypothetical protein